MRVNRTEYAILGFFCMIAIFLEFAETTPFWKAWFYTAFQGLSFFLLIDLLKNKKINKYLVYSALIFDMEYLAFNILVAYYDMILFKKFITVQWLSGVFLCSVFVLLLTTFIYNVWGRKREF